ncbi:MAG: hypothetical protein QG656_1175, partial [Candidatus Hydrogenedentes bacterium]|nr:hypothetical protein [Candidatus Hydrogenedentota bacterium]
MRFRICNALICVSLVLVLAGCPKANTCSIRTDAIYCVFAIEIQSGVVTARAKLNVGNPFGTVLTVDPSCGDQVTANGVVLTPTIPLALFGHTAAIPSAPEYEFVLTRQGEEPYRYT